MWSKGSWARSARLASSDRPLDAERYVAAVNRGLEFASSLVIDARQADLLRRPSRAIGGVRSWHGELYSAPTWRATIWLR